MDADAGMRQRFSANSNSAATGSSVAPLSSFFFFSSRRRHTRFDCDWSSDVCSSDLSSDVRAVTVQLYRSKKLLIPMLIFADYGVPVVAASYLLTGRFNPEREFEKHPDRKSVV